MFWPVINVVDVLVRAPQSPLPPVALALLEGVPVLGLRGSVAQGLDLVQVALLHAEREPEVYQLEHLILSGPENVVRLEVSMDEAVSVEAEQRGQNIPISPLELKGHFLTALTSSLHLRSSLKFEYYLIDSGWNCQSQARLRPKRCLDGFIMTIIK